MGKGMSRQRELRKVGGPSSSQSRLLQVEFRSYRKADETKQVYRYHQELYAEVQSLTLGSRWNRSVSVQSSVTIRWWRKDC